VGYEKIQMGEKRIMNGYFEQGFAKIASPLKQRNVGKFKLDKPGYHRSLYDEHGIGVTSRHTEVDVDPKKLTKALGAPPPGGDPHKETGCYLFKDKKGNRYELYDWKSTSNYHGEGNAPSPEEFWGLPRIRLNIGSTKGNEKNSISLAKELQKKFG